MFVMPSGIGTLNVRRANWIMGGSGQAGRRSGVITLEDLAEDSLAAAITLTRRLSPDIFASMKIYKGALR